MNLVSVACVDGAAVDELVCVPPVDVKVGDVHAAVAHAARVLRVLLRSDPDQPVLVQIDGQRLQAGQQHVHADVKLGGECITLRVLF